MTGARRFSNGAQRIAWVGGPMAYESIPVNWEMLTLLGGVAVTTAGGAWKVANSIAKYRLEALQTKYNEEQKRANDEQRRAINAEAEAAKLKLDLSGSTKRIVDLLCQIEELQADLQRALTDVRGPEEADEQLKIIEDLRAKLAKLDELKEALLGEEDEVWKLRKKQPPDDFARRMRESSPAIITVVNLKGGVGKTTLVAGLAGYFSTHRKRVLLIDFDYQGSLTRMMMLGAKLQLGTSVLAGTILNGETTGEDLVERSRDLGGTLRNTRLVTCGQTFDGEEFRLLFRWLLHETEDDVRFRLANLLLSPEVQEQFDVVLIDGPPRLSAGLINALCASHAVLIPTVLDPLSVDAVGRLVERANELFRPLNPGLEFAGVIGSLTETSGLTPVEERALDQAQAALGAWPGESHLFHNRVRHFRALAEAAGRNIGYLNDKGVKAAFNAIGQELSKQPIR
jgi:cellulose biosynthesis protein BcsQ